ncbi:MAG: hypothetical protein RIA71_13970 [Oceanicaulis sp.]
MAFSYRIASSPASGLAAGLAACSLGVFAGPAHAQEPRFELRSENMIARSDPFSPDDELLSPLGAAFDLETGFDSNTWASWIRPLQGRKVVRVQGQVRARTYFDRDELNSALLTPRVQYWDTFAENRVQVRLLGQVSVLNRDGGRQWTRPEAEAQLRYRPAGDRSLETVARVRVTQYDFDRAGLDGLDSDRVRFGLEQFFRFEGERAELRLSAFHETADARDDAFSFDEVRASAELTFRPDEKTSLSLLADYRDRDYDADFSAAFPEPRADQRFIAEARVERQVSQRLTAFVSSGYLENASNISIRDYDGATFQLGFRLTL